MNAEIPQPANGAEALHTLKDELLAAWRQLPPEHQATMALVLLDTVMEGEWGIWARQAIQTLWPIVEISMSRSETSEREKTESLNPRHFYAAYIFNRAESRERDVNLVIENAQRLGYPLHPRAFRACGYTDDTALHSDK